MKGAWIIIADIGVKDGQIPEWILLFQEGWSEIEGEGKFLTDRQAFEVLAKYLERRGNDIVYDYEHQSVQNVKAPAAGWLKEIKYEDGVGIMARVEWTEEAAGYIAKKEYRYFSPVFFVRKSDKRVVAMHSVALTNAPKINHLTPLLAKLGADLPKKEVEAMEFFKKLFAKLGLADGATEDEVFAAIAKISDKPPETKEVIAKDILDALNLTEGDTSTVVASIHALNQGAKGVVSREEFNKLQSQLLAKDVTEVVAKALGEGKITPDQKDWATEYATRDLKGFNTFVAKATVVVPLKDLPSKTQEADSAVLDATVRTVAKLMDVSEEDIKKYGT